MAKRYEISDWEWERIENLFPTPKTGRPPKWNNKTMLNVDYVIPPKQNAKNPWSVDWYLYKERHLVECFSINSSSFVVFPPDMTNWLLRF